ncbi:MAG: carboxypeptidase-like regulatory domain-containing protein [Elusimicrobiota bacterium]|nr:carboxypeptidase-like regulatory domain-containing protein [Elusimicrobiota bacterium]
MIFLVLFCLLCISPVWALNIGDDEIVKGKLTVGIEAGTIFNQDLKLKENPNLTVTETDYDTATSVTTTKNYDYFNYAEPSAWGSTTTYTRSWGDIQNKTNILLLKCGYAVMEGMEAAVKLGIGDKRIYYTEKTTEKYRSLWGNYDRNTTLTTRTNNFPQGFGYGLEIKGEPYKANNLRVQLGAQIYRQKNKVDLSDTYDIEKSTAGMTNDESWGKSSSEIEELGYQLSAVCSVKTGRLTPYFGLAFVDGNIKLKQKGYSEYKNYSNGVFQQGARAERTVESELKPKNNFTMILGLNLPVNESGIINVEGKLLGETSVSVGSSIKFNFSSPRPRSARNERTQKQTNYIKVKVTNAKGDPVAKAVIKISQGENIISKEFADNNGEFNSADLPIGKYTVKVWKHGIASEKIVYVSDETLAEINFVLKKK